MEKNMSTSSSLISSINSVIKLNREHEEAAELSVLCSLGFFLPVHSHPLPVEETVPMPFTPPPPAERKDY
jgi:hypothetical protein